MLITRRIASRKHPDLIKSNSKQVVIFKRDSKSVAKNSNALDNAMDINESDEEVSNTKENNMFLEATAI